MVQGQALTADALGTVHPPAGSDARIVSLVPSITELLFVLGLGARVVGRTKFCVHPRAAVACVPRVGGTKDVRMDRLRALAPTHVIVNVDENTLEAAREIATFVPHLIVTHPRAPHDNRHLYRLLGGIFGRHTQAERLCKAFDRALARLLALRARLPARRVLYLIWRRPWMTVGPDTYIARMLELVCWQVASGGAARYPEVEITPATLAGIDLVLLSSEPFPFRERHARELQAAGDACPPIEFIDGELVSWYGSRAIHGLDYLGRFAARCAGMAEATVAT